MTRHYRALLSLAVSLSVLGCDQGTKRMAELSVKYSAGTSYLFNLLQIRYAENTGAWGSMGSDWSDPIRLIFLMLIPSLVLIGLAAALVHLPGLRRMQVAGLALILGGGLSNVLDRILYGYVVDFLYLGIGAIGTNIFNIADVAIMAGLGFLILDGWRERDSIVEHESYTAARPLQGKLSK